MSSRTHTLSCAFSNDLGKPFCMEYAEDHDNINTLKKRIQDRLPERFQDTTLFYYKLKLYRPVKRLDYEEEFRLKDGELLHPRLAVTSHPLFPDSKDPNVDIVAVVTSRKRTYFGRKRVTDNPTICPRDRTVSELAATLDQMNIVLVCGAPGSGKTYLARLLAGCYRDRGRKVFCINIWEGLDVRDPWGSLSGLLESYDEELEKPSLELENDPDWRLKSEAVILVDEAELSYTDAALWNVIIRERLNGTSRYNFRLCLFCSYANPRTGIDDKEASFSPATLSDEQRLYYSREEFEYVVIRSLTYKYVENLRLDKHALDYIFELSNGHPMAVDAIIEVIYDEYRHEVKHRIIRIVTKDHVARVLEDTTPVFGKMRHRIIAVTFPDTARLKIGGSDMLNRILEEGKIPFTMDDENIKICYQNGWIYRVAQDDGDIAVLPSPFHEKFVEYSAGNKPNPLPRRFDSLPKLCEEILLEFSAMSLKASAENSELYRAGRRQHLYEFYRCFCKVAGHGVQLWSLWSIENTRMDFYIPEKKWAVKLITHHDRLDKTVSWFREGGDYQPWEGEYEFDEYIIIDCATSLPTSDISEPNLWYAVFGNGYRELKLHNHKKELLRNTYVWN